MEHSRCTCRHNTSRYDTRVHQGAISMNKYYTIVDSITRWLSNKFT